MTATMTATVTPAPRLQRLARLAQGPPEQVLDQLLHLLCEQLGMDLALVATVEDGGSTVRRAVAADGAVPDGLVGVTGPLAATWCSGVLREGRLLVPDATTEPELAALPVTRALGVCSFAGTVLRDADGGVVGTLCALGHRPQPLLTDRDQEVLEGLACVVAPWLQALLAPRAPAQRPAVDLDRLARTVHDAVDVEGLTRPLLDALHELTGISSTYLTVVHEAAGEQEIRYARNASADFAIPEGLHVPWSDTLCKRALDEGRSCTTDVPAVWGDSQAAVDLGIQTYVSVPVRLADGQPWGTLCCADDVVHQDAAEHLPVLTLFARLIAAEADRAAQLELARREAETDALTGCGTRRTVQPWLDRALADLPDDLVVAVVFVDVDRFKAVNDGHGHATGDAVLRELGSRLQAASRDGDLVARLGGDEFLVAAKLPRAAAATLAARVDRAAHFTLDDLEVRCSTGLAISDAREGGSALLALADAEMYRAKAGR